ncbi:MAG TPA: M23 family metallopeptidase [Beijerinckiaceae bacterium]|jgi:murein DD-endopeptidase MepM/ murein hydrolase activator NlpD
MRGHHLITRLLKPGLCQLAARRETVLAVAAAFVLLAVWAAVTAWYFLFQDDIATRLIARQSEMQQNYEHKLAELRAQLDRAASQRLVEQNGLEGRLAEISARQSQLETRQGILAKLSNEVGIAATGTGADAARGDVPLAQAPPRAAAAATDEARRKPTPEPFGLRLRGAESDQSPAGPPSTPRPETRVLPAERLTQIQRSLNAIEGAQLQTLHALLRATEAQMSGLRDAVGEAGLNPDVLDNPARGGVGGPFVPLVIDPGAGSFDSMLRRLRASHAQLGLLRRTAAALPFGRPVPGDIDLTSGYGYRIDPFTRAPAMHTGIDFRADYGAPVRAAGTGQVVSAEYAGGYGNMVEVDHGNGVITRYAHLSSIRAAVGDTVDSATVLGRVGSTGRSTGAHLHYETRVDGEPVDPQRFLRAGSRLAVMQSDP